MNKPVIFHFLLADWDIDPRKPLLKEIMKVASAWSEPVLIQQPVCLVVHFFTKFRRKIIGLFSGKYKTRKICEGAVLFTPVILFNYSLWLQSKFIAKIDIYLFKLQFDRFVCKYYPNNIIILWFFSNILYPLVNSIKNNFVIYDYQDNYDYKSNGTWSKIDAHYNEILIKRSDLVICTAKAMFNRAKPLNNNSLYIPNGNNFEIFSKTKRIVFQQDIFANNKKIIGFLGNIRNWLDFDLINKMVVELKDINLLFIGYLNRESKKDIYKLTKFKNFTWMPYIEQDKVAPYIRRFNVGIIPFKINNYMEGVFPNKFFEYMAAEVPIVTTALIELKEYSEIIGYSYNHEEFISNCISALEGRFNDKIKSTYKTIAAANSWEKKAGIINKRLNQIIKTK